MQLHTIDVTASELVLIRLLVAHYVSSRGNQLRNLGESSPASTAKELSDAIAGANVLLGKLPVPMISFGDE